MPAIVKLLVGLAGVTLLAYAAYFSLREPIQNDLTTRVKDALRAEGFMSVEVSSGAPDEAADRNILLTGRLSDARAAQAVAIAEDVGGVHSAEWRGQPLDIVTPFDWRAEFNGQLLILSGHVPDSATANALIELGAELFGPDVESSMVVAAGAPQGNWQGAAAAGLQSLRQLKTGYVSLSDARVTLFGRTQDPEVKRAVVAGLRDRLPSGFAGQDAIQLDGQLLPRDVDAAALKDCERRLNAVVADEKIVFASGSADIRPESTPLLEQLALVARDCPAARITIAGHTDTSGDADFNKALSESRAESVLNYLASNGLSPDRLTAIGYGEERPLVEGETAEANAANRRIEFYVAAREGEALPVPGPSGPTPAGEAQAAEPAP